MGWWNVKGYEGQKAQTLLGEEKLDILGVTETWMGEREKLPEIIGYVSFNFPQDFGRQKRTGGGIAIYVRSESTFEYRVWRARSTHVWMCITCGELEVFVAIL